MQVNVICNYCGAESFSEARFCRQCGRLLEERQAASVTEGTTRLFDSPPKSKTTDPFSNANEWAPINKVGTNPISIPTGKETQILTTQKAKSYTGLIIGGVAAFAVVGILAAFLVLFFLRSSAVNAPTHPPQPEVPIVPPVNPPPPPGATKISELKYPGAETNFETDGSMMLTTNDSVEKISKWYADRLNTTPKMRMAGTHIFTLEGLNIVITNKGADGNTTRIILSNEGDSQ